MAAKNPKDGERPGQAPDSGPQGVSGAEAEDIEDRSNPRPAIVYEVLRREGEAEMDRPLGSLAWSGLGAGISIAFSTITEGVLRSHLPQSGWAPLVSRLGYSVGFLIVVLGRQQLFTENTITAVLPVTSDFGLRSLARMGRLWAIVLAANLVGTFAAALLCVYSAALPPDVFAAVLAIAREGQLADPALMFWRAIPAGFLVAAMVWMLPTADQAKVLMIVVMTYLIALAEFKHVIAGSFEAFLLVLTGALTPVAMIGGFLLPVLAGNIIGGTGLFALLSYGQVAEEV
jgi:formate/nitrite transporter FocA (FNT family)